jgi:inorganic triphosphatase YgiF
MNVPLEIELKLALPPAQAAAFVRRMARRRSVPLEQDLVTLYFDTPDVALSAAGLALRLRRSGRRWVQTLKTEGERAGGLSRRVEFEMAVKRGALDWSRFPPEARACVPEVLRGTLAPAFETHFHRTVWQVRGHGGAQIEVALDVGEVRAGERREPLCEIELELKAGHADALFALALDWADTFDCLPLDTSKAERGARLARGAASAPAKAAPLRLDPHMSVEAGFAATVQHCLAQFQANLPGVLSPLGDPRPHAGAGAETEYVHQARVALRRLRAALRLYRKACALPEPLLDGLRTLVAVLGPARDWDVLCEETLPAIAPHTHDSAAWMAGMQVLEAQRRTVHAGMREALAAARPGSWLLAMQRWLQQHGWRQVPKPQRLAQTSPLVELARRALRRGQRRVMAGARAFPSLAAAQRHALRIAIKRQRYAVEFFEPLFPARRQVPYLAALRRLQDGLGRCNDAHVGAALLQGAGPVPAPMAAFACGWLAAVAAGCGGDATATELKIFVKLRSYW